VNSLWNLFGHYQWHRDPTAQGAPDLQDANIYCGFFQTEFHLPDRRQYSERYGSNATNNYMPRAPQYLFHSHFLTKIVNACRPSHMCYMFPTLLSPI
jgi:hypothetical protein